MAVFLRDRAALFIGVSSLLEVVCFLWRPPSGYRSQFTPQHVNVLRSMVARHYRAPHRFSVVSDIQSGFDKGIRVIPLWDDHANVRTLHGDRNPSCYRRLKLFAPEAEKIIGRRFVCLDIDTVIVRDMSRVWDRKEDIVLWSDTNPKNPYNGSMILHTAGTRIHVWETFDPIESPKAALAAGYFGSDQAWLCHSLGPKEARWSRQDGVYSWRVHVRRPHRGALPNGARIVFFHGKQDPWSPEIQAGVPWVRENWR